MMPASPTASSGIGPHGQPSLLLVDANMCDQPELWPATT